MNEKRCDVRGGKIFLSGVPIAMPYDVVETVVFKDIVLVRLESPIGTIFNRNVYALTATGQEKLQIQECPHGAASEKPYVHIAVNKAGSVIAANWIGIDYKVDPEDGTVAVLSFTK